MVALLAAFVIVEIGVRLSAPSGFTFGEELQELNVDYKAADPENLPQRQSGWNSTQPQQEQSWLAQTDKQISRRKFAYALYIDLTFWPEVQLCNAKVLVYFFLSLRNPANPVDIVAVYPEGQIFGDNDTSWFADQGVRLYAKPLAATKGVGGYSNSFFKLRVAQLEEYDRVVYLDSDAMPLQNLDHLFDLPLGDAMIAAPRAYWLSGKIIFSGGPMIIVPSVSLEKKLAPMFSTQLRGYYGEMDWVNQALAHNALFLNDSYATLVSEFIPGDKMYSHFSRTLGKSRQDVLLDAPAVHFVADNKPWRKAFDRVAVANKGSPQLIELADRWLHVRDIVCPRTVE